MINKKILISAMSIVTSLAMVGGATFAFFSDQGTSSDNIFSSGNMDMLLSDTDQTDLDDVSGTWGLASAPGDPFTGDLKIKNSGTVDADHIELQFSNAVTEAVSGPGTVSAVPMDRVLEITSLLWDHDGDGTPTVDLLASVIDLNSNGIIDLDDLENQNVDGAVDADNVAFGGTQANDHTLRIAGEFSGTLAENQHQGDSVNMTLGVTMNQNVAQ
ncbi:MAG: TasA family protein [bacterium]|nr:TasA family protein [bacterium]